MNSSVLLRGQTYRDLCQNKTCTQKKCIFSLSIKDRRKKSMIRLKLSVSNLTFFFFLTLTFGYSWEYALYKVLFQSLWFHITYSFCLIKLENKEVHITNDFTFH